MKRKWNAKVLQSLSPEVTIRKLAVAEAFFKSGGVIVDNVDRKYKHYLYDLVDLLKARALEAKDERNRAPKESPEYFFQAGRLLVFNEVLSFMQQEAEGFDIALRDLRLEDIVPDRDLT